MEKNKTPLLSMWAQVISKHSQWAKSFSYLPWEMLQQGENWEKSWWKWKKRRTNEYGKRGGESKFSAPVSIFPSNSPPLHLTSFLHVAASRPNRSLFSPLFLFCVPLHSFFNSPAQNVSFLSILHAAGRAHSPCSIFSFQVKVRPYMAHVALGLFLQLLSFNMNDFLNASICINFK